MSSPFNPKPTALLCPLPFHSLKKTKTAAQSLPPQLPFTHLDLNYFSTIWPCLFNLPKPLEPFPLFSAWKLYLVQDWFNHRLLCEAFPSQTAQGFCLCLITAFDPTVLVYLSVNIIHNSLKDRNSFLFTFLLPPSNPGPPKQTKAPWINDQKFSLPSKLLQTTQLFHLNCSKNRLAYTHTLGSIYILNNQFSYNSILARNSKFWWLSKQLACSKINSLEFLIYVSNS